MPWTEVRKKDKDKTKGNSTGKTLQDSRSKKHHGNFYATLGDGSALVFLEDVP